jgi:hypothetical protein
MGHGGGVRPIKFFRTYIASLSGPEIVEYLDDLKRDSNKINEEIAKLTYHMPNLTWSEAWDLSPSERNTMVGVINEVRGANKDKD